MVIENLMVKFPETAVSLSKQYSWNAWNDIELMKSPDYY